MFVDDFLLPTGNLRESKTGAKRADVILVTKCPNDLDQSAEAKVLKKLKKFDKEVFLLQFLTEIKFWVLKKFLPQILQVMKFY